MYYTDEFSEEMQYDCLRYTIFDDIANYVEAPILQHQFILYCFRPFQSIGISRKSKTTLMLNENGSIVSALSFEQLKMKNISIFDLFTWSAPIDLVERYADYLVNGANIDTDYQEIFYNCTLPWFGPTCQYTFDTDTSFLTVVKNNFRERHNNDNEIRNPNMTCYIHLPCIYRNWGPTCLDWREICDGKIDCINNGADEQNCFDLEKNECEENEYRCHNGLCIPKEFVRDGNLSPECLDRTDEVLVSRYPDLCSADPSFRCEEHTCKPYGRAKLGFPCGDGQCFSGKVACNNERGDWRHRIAMHFNNQDFCWMAMHCFTKFLITQIDENYIRQCANLTDAAGRNIIRINCPFIFDFPIDILFYGHVRLLYINNDTMLTDLNFPPAYVCYKKELCKFLSSTIYLTTINNESLSCQHFRELNLTKDAYLPVESIYTMKKLFQVCSSIDISTYDLNDSTSLFHCPNSRKYISKHRLLDGIRDCEGNEDENYQDSCALNDKYRFKCQGDGRCIAPILVDDGAYDCRDYTDETKKANLEYKTQISFQTLCDGFVELTPLMIDEREETDESDCENWPCNNTYTRCDGIWNCANGADEINCPSMSICPPLEHICISPVTHNITCLSIDKVNNGKIDCLGGTDERYYCEKAYAKFPSSRFRCNNNPNQCVGTEQLCDDSRDCRQGEDEQFCLTNTKFCSSLLNNKRTVSEEFLCQLKTTNKLKIVYFDLQNFPNYPPFLFSQREPPSSYMNYTSSSTSQSVSYSTPTSWPSRWRCNRGLNIRFHQEYKCLCPPSYYGDLCEYQNQRVSVTFRVRTEAEWFTIFIFLITLIDDNEHIINSYDQFSYIAIRDCNTKFNIYLSYGTRPKDVRKNFSIRIDAFDRHSFIHRASWLYPIRFSFLPVYRTAIYLTIPWIMTTGKNCKLYCNHGHCIHIVNNPNNAICKCDYGWSGKQCHIKQKCNCSPYSLCMGSINNRSVCLCPTGTFGSRCFLTQNVCQSQPCHNNGQCIPNDFGRRGKLEYVCICKEGYSGDNCERIDTRIEISFQSTIKVPSSILAHFISINTKTHPTRTTLFKKIGFNENSAILFTYIQFRLLFTQFDNNYYLTVHKSTQSYLDRISTVVIPSHRCLSIQELFNTTILNFHILRRLKYYHLPCKEHIDLVCFYDSLHICLCTTDRHANCFEFDHNVTYNCQEQQICTNKAQCFQNHPVCPTASICACQDCFYGSRCQYSTKSFDLSLDIILGYHIQSNISFFKQPTIVKVSTAFVILIFVTGLISGICSILTFQAKNSQKVGCGLYLLTTSIISILIATIFSLKMILLIMSRMKLITQQSIRLSNCIMIDFLLRILLSASDWLSACVATERAVAIGKGVYFNLPKSKLVSKYNIIFVLVLVIVTALHDPFHRRLVDDLDDGNIWCVIIYSDQFALFNSIVIIFHFLTPFIINIISAIFIIIMSTRQRSSVQKQLTRREHFYDQFRQHKHLLISSCVLILLALPRLVMSFLSGCMSSSRESWFFLVGYFISFTPPILTFFIFVLPSTTYKTEFLSTIKKNNK